MPSLNRGLLNTTALTNVGALSLGLAMISGSALALPQNGQVVGGQATITQVSPTQLDINQQTNRAVINWKSFSIGGNETTDFNQPNAGSVAFNRVTGVDPSTIMGHLNANGQVVLINPNGVLFTKNAQVNVGGLVASTAGISNTNAMAGNMVFDQRGGKNAAIVNRGTITARAGGLVALVAPSVVNSGVITAHMGKVALSSGDKWTLDLYGDRLVSFAVDDKTRGSVTNDGIIRANGGDVELTANVAKNVVSNAINMHGYIEANSASKNGGTIILEADNGTINANGGVMNASGVNGGSITVKGNTVDIDNATLFARGNTNGGAITTEGHTVNYGTATIDTTGKTGKSGSWLLSADDLVINKQQAAVIGHALNGSYVTLQTTPPQTSGETGDIRVNSAIAWNNDDSLHFSAFRNIDVNAAVTDGQAGEVIMRADNTANGTGAVNIGKKSSVTTGGTLSIYYDPTSYAKPVVYSVAQARGAEGTTAYMLVNTVADLENIDTNLSGDYALGHQINNIGKIAPIGSAAHPFSGIFDGDGGLGMDYILRNVTVAGGTDAGLFSVNTGTIRNVILKNEVVSGRTNVGGLVGLNEGTVSHDIIRTSNVRGLPDSTDVGGLVGQNTGLVLNSRVNDVSVVADAGSTNVGGLVGDNSGTVKHGVVRGSYVQANNGSSNVGGLVGRNEAKGLITASGATDTTMRATNVTNMGGLAGYNLGNVTDSVVNNMRVDSNDGSTNVAGDVGNNAGTVSFANPTAADILYNISVTGGTNVGMFGINTGLIEGVFVRNETITGQNDVGGLVGLNNGVVFDDAVRSSDVVGNRDSKDVGGLVGQNNGDIVRARTNNVTVVANNGSTNIGGLVGDNSGTLEHAVARAAHVTAYGSSDIGGLVGTNEAKGLITASGVIGTQLLGYRVASIGGLVGYNIGNVVDSVIRDIKVLATKNSTAIGGFAGTNAGTVSFTNPTSADIISNVTVQGGSDVGMFGVNTGLIEKVFVRNDHVAGTDNVGGLVGLNDGTVFDDVVRSSFVRGFSGSDDVGGLVGQNNGTVTRARTNNVSVTADAASTNVGGLVGDNNGYLRHDVARAASVLALKGSSDIGGLVGLNGAAGDITASGAVDTSVVGNYVTSIGGLAGYNIGSITNSDVTNGKVTSNFNGSRVGGFVGTNEGTISGSTVTGEVVRNGNGGEGTGGFVGISDGTLTNDTAKANVIVGNTDSDVGGFAGQNAPNGTIIDAVYTGSLFAGSNAAAVGGLVGNNRGVVSGGSAAGHIHVLDTSHDVGGFVGDNFGNIFGGSSSINVNALTNVIGVGGFAGYNLGTISGASESGNVLVGNQSIDIAAGIGDNEGTITSFVANGGVRAAAAGQSVGGAVGVNGLTGVLNNVTANGDVKSGPGSFSIGGLAGYNAGSIENSAVNNAKVDGGANSVRVGGFAGTNEGTIANSTVTATIVRNRDSGEGTGGFVGINGGTLNDDVAAHSRVIVGANDSDVGGFVGDNTTSGTINGGASSGGVFAGTNGAGVAGFVGDNRGQVNGGRAVGHIKVADASHGVGGFIGDNYGMVLGGFAREQINALSNVLGVGGFAGYNLGTLSGGSALGAVNVGDQSFYIGGGVGWNDAGGSVDNLTANENVTAGAASTAIGGIVGLNGSDPTNNRGSFSAASAVIQNSKFNGTITAGIDSFAIAGLAGWNSAYLAGNTGAGPLFFGSIDAASTGTGNVVPAAGDTYIHGVNQVGCDERGTGNCFGVAGQEIITIDVNSFTITQGDADPVFTSTMSVLIPGNPNSVQMGFESGDTEADVIANQMLTRAQGTNPGVYSIMDGAVLNPNDPYAKYDYKLIVNNGTLTVNAPGTTPTNPTNPTNPVTPVNPVVPAGTLNATPIAFQAFGDIVGLNALQQVTNGAFGAINAEQNQVNCLKVNSEIRGVTTDSPIDCSAPLQVNGF